MLHDPLILLIPKLDLFAYIEGHFLVHHITLLMKAITLFVLSGFMLGPRVEHLHLVELMKYTPSLGI